MNRNVTLLAGFLCLVAALGAGSSDSLLSQWSKYKVEFGRQYKSPAEEAERFKIFSENKLRIDRFNADKSEQAGYTQNVNRFSDMTENEKHQFLGNRKDMFDKRYLKPQAYHTRDEFLAELLAGVEPLPAEVDWRKEGRVTSIKDQGQCGSCWAFAAIGLLEGQEKPQRNIDPAISLSVQELIDCDGWMNCSGGGLPDALNVTIKLTGLMSEQDYPYTAKNGFRCNLDKSKIAMSLKNYAVLPQNDEITMKKVVANYGPVGVSVDATSKSFQHYSGGVYSDEGCGTGLSHCVLIVGYGTDTKYGDYWIIKNQWSEQWGEKGYMRLAMGKNLCMIAWEPVIATF